ncbi:hypothetical protein DH2020_034111 [Rehmannia glutinosa]|uniref:Membrane-associated kinase regulator 6 n=1 Tax=Rehmannia glutinosa TaxID=99300 RepID=A0ABR0VAE6_REHGL
METTLQSPSIDSFSYSWIPFDQDTLPSSTVDPSDHDEANSFIEMDPRLPPSKRFFRVSSSDFCFDFPVTNSPLGLVHADELISNGFLVPLFVKDVKLRRFDDVEDYSYISSSSASGSNNSASSSTTRKNTTSLRRCQRLSKRFFQKYFKYILRPLLLFYRRRRGSSSNMRMKWELSAATQSPRTSLAYSGDDNWRRSCDSESSIHEAVLHCKRTQGNLF